MKREAFTHPKMLALAASLDVSRAAAIGHVTLLLNWTVDVAVQGNVGKWPNGAIARACEWLGDPDVFVNALVECGWLDTDSDYRLVIHDWPDHCERFVKSKLASAGLDFLPCYSAQVPKKGDVSADASSDASSDPPRDQTKPNQTKPNPTKPGSESAGAEQLRRKSKAVTLEAISFPETFDTPEVRKAVQDWLEFKRAKGESYKQPAHLEKKFSEFARYGPSIFCQAIDTAIGNNWAGFFPPKDSSNGHAKNSRNGSGQRCQGTDY